MTENKTNGGKGAPQRTHLSDLERWQMRAARAEAEAAELSVQVARASLGAAQRALVAAERVLVAKIEESRAVADRIATGFGLPAEQLSVDLDTGEVIRPTAE
jgi:hypothetical protein